MENKNIATLETEIYKADAVAINRLGMYRKLQEMYGTNTAEEYLRQLEEHEIYRHDEVGILGKSYCASVTLYPFLFYGNTCIGGTSEAPKNLSSFCGAFINLVFALASQFCGAISTPEFLSYMDYFIRKEYGDDYNQHPDEVVDLSTRHRTMDKVITDAFEQVVYSINQPAAARGNQCVRADKTQLWTPNGFKYLSELKEGDPCYVWKNGTFAIESIDRLNCFDFDGELLQFYGCNYQQTVTPNHRVVYRSTDGSNQWIIRTAEEVEHHSKLSMPISGEFQRADYPIEDNYLKLATYALTDGNLKGREDSENKSLVYYMSPNRKGLKDVLNSLEALSIPYSNHEYKTRFGIIRKIVILSTDAQPILSIINSRRDQIPDCFLMLSTHQARLVLQCWANSDGQVLNNQKSR